MVMRAFTASPARAPALPLTSPGAGQQHPSRGGSNFPRQAKRLQGIPLSLLFSRRFRGKKL